MEMKVLVLSIVLCCVSAGVFLVQPLHQSAPDQQRLQILTKMLLSLTNQSGMEKKNYCKKIFLKKNGILCCDGI